MAKEIGFNEPCLFFYNDNQELSGICEIKIEYRYYNHVCTKACAAPLYQQLVDFFRINHKIEISVYYESIIGWWYSLNSMKNDAPLVPTDYRKDYYKSLNKALEEAFKLIKS